MTHLLPNTGVRLRSSDGDRPSSASSPWSAASSLSRGISAQLARVVGFVETPLRLRDQSVCAEPPFFVPADAYSHGCFVGGMVARTRRPDRRVYSASGSVTFRPTPVCRPARAAWSDPGTRFRSEHSRPRTKHRHAPVRRTGDAAPACPDSTPSRGRDLIRRRLRMRCAGCLLLLAAVRVAPRRGAAAA